MLRWTSVAVVIMAWSGGTACSDTGKGDAALQPMTPTGTPDATGSNGFGVAPGVAPSQTAGSSSNPATSDPTPVPSGGAAVPSANTVNPNPSQSGSPTAAPTQPSSSGSDTSDGTPSPDTSTGATDDATDDTPGDTTSPPAQAAAIESLSEYLAVDRNQREPLGDQAFVDVALTAEQATEAARLLWEDRAAFIAETRRAEHEARAITVDGQTLRYDFTTFGDAPPDGRSLYLSLHGGGNAEPSVNDQQWENQKGLYQPDEGIYLAPRAPTNTWNLWHEAHIDPMFARLITNFVVLENVNPDRVYVMGYSAGGDGVYQLGPRMADYWAAAAAMAGHPNEAQPLSLRNIGFTVHVGALDTGFDRNLVAQEWRERLAELQASDPDGYPHVVEIHAGKPHWMDLEDAVAVPWMAAFTRDTTPERIVWYQDDITHSSFYWLAVRSPQAGTSITARVDGQHIEVTSEDVTDLSVRLSDELLDLDQSLSVSLNGVEVHSGSVERTIAVLAQTLEEREDPRLMFSAEIALD